LHADNYHSTRLNSPTVKFSLQCRIQAISRGIKRNFPSGADKLLDLGGSDGLLARGINTLVPHIENVYSLDMDRDLLKLNPFPSAQGDCCILPFNDNTFNVITAAALIEHLPDPHSFLKECYRVLKPGGMLFLTCPVPFFEWLATKVGYESMSVGHFARYSLSDVQEYCEIAGFSFILAEKFMISPIYFPGYLFVESLIRRLGLSFLMMNQCAGAAKRAIQI